jgi:Fe-S-cluster containining protein
MGDRCTGGCCREFSLPTTPEQLRADASAASIAPALRDEFLKIADLAVFVRTLERGGPMPNGKTYDGATPVPIYTCRFFDGANCTNYDERPNMCRGYPYDRPCEHGDACEFDDAREGRHPGKVSLPVLG